MIPYAFTCRLIDHALAELAERVEAMPAGDFIDQHTAVHAETRSPTIDLVASVLEREFWRRWPEGREDG
ncbi:hypothetical protein [Mesorhizobium sp. CAU 1741]|uniref:hypothetical protein n=1 Tax=Mesorhizobium sp. CAU 1741 TaxID=3140366 RepID=UPI00325BE644